MTLFLVEHRLPRVNDGDLALMQAALAVACARLTDRGEAVSYLGSTFLPTSKRLLSLFEAVSAQVVRRATNSSQVPPSVLEVAIDLPNRREA